jgi:hypothetical protein
MRGGSREGVWRRLLRYLIQSLDRLCSAKFFGTLGAFGAGQWSSAQEFVHVNLHMSDSNSHRGLCKVGKSAAKILHTIASTVSDYRTMHLLLGNRIGSVKHVNSFGKKTNQVADRVRVGVGRVTATSPLKATTMRKP